jgi:hypothetical protein
MLATQTFVSSLQFFRERIPWEYGLSTPKAFNKFEISQKKVFIRKYFYELFKITRYYTVIEHQRLVDEFLNSQKMFLRLTNFYVDSTPDHVT